MQRLQRWILAAAALGLVIVDAGCIIGFKVETSTSATAGDDDSQGSQSASATTTAASATEGTTEGTSEGTSEGTTTTGATEASTEATTTGDTTTTTSATTETGGGGECEIDAECMILSDCCACAGVPFGEEPAACDEICDVTRCEALGVTAPVCRFGTCTTQRVPCDDSKILCDQAPPACDPGMVAVVDAQSVCYTGECAPAELCDRVPECALCPAEWMCVSTVTLEGTLRTCEPVPPLCEGTPSCACASGYACDAVYNQCDDEGNELTCSCVDC